jgi:hypothetical protein
MSIFNLIGYTNQNKNYLYLKNRPSDYLLKVRLWDLHGV